jgi:flagellin
MMPGYQYEKDFNNMAFSIQTNVNSLVAQENLRVNGDFQGRTIQRLTSGYRINSSGDDAAGLAVANKFRSDTAELTQGIRNANDGVSQLQIMDGGLNNISKMLDRMKTLATQSASTTFTGDRTTLNNEYTVLKNEITRQAANVGLGTGDVNATRYNTSALNVYLGGGSQQANAKVSVDLTGVYVNSVGLNLEGTSVAGNTTAVAVASGTDLSGDDALVNASQRLTFRTGNNSITTVDLTGGAAGLSRQEILQTINSQVGQIGITAAFGSDGKLTLASASAFQFETAALTGSGAGTAKTIATAAQSTLNTGIAVVTGQTIVAQTAGDAAETYTFTLDSDSSTLATVTTGAGAQSIAQITASFSAALNGTDVSFAVDNSGKISFQSTKGQFTITRSAGAGQNAIGIAASGTSQSSAPSAVDPTTAALDAIEKLGTAVSTLGTVQGKIGTGQNQLQYAIQLAQSQIANFSAAESRIRDADVAQEAANLTKAQVLQQASLAAMAQANSAPQAVLALLRG